MSNPIDSAPLPSTSPPGLKRILVGCVIAFVISLVIIGCLFAYFYSKFVDTGDAIKTVQADAAAYRRAGFAWEAKEFLNPAVTPTNNAAPLLEKASLLHGTKDFANWLTKAQLSMKAGNYRDALKQIAPFQDSLVDVEKATSMPYLHYDRDPDIAFLSSFDAFSSNKGFAKVLSIRAQIEAHDHNFSAAVRDLTVAWKLGVLTGQEPDLVAMLADVACQRIVLDGIQKCMAFAMDKPGASEPFAAILSHQADRPSLSRALKGEAYNGLSMLRNFSQMKQGDLMTFSDRGQVPSKPTNHVDTSKWVRTGLPAGNTALGFAARHFQGWLKVKDAMDQSGNDFRKLVEALNKYSDEMSSKKSISYLLIDVTASVLPEEARVVCELEAETRATCALLNAMSMRQKTGQWPRRITDIPGTWTDPFTDRPLLVKQTSDGFKVYSVGPNLKDDGGMRQSDITDDNKKADYDIVASYPPRKLR